VRTALPAFTLHRGVAFDASVHAGEPAVGRPATQEVEVLEWHSRPSILALHETEPAAALENGESQPNGDEADGSLPEQPTPPLRYVAVNLADHYVGDGAIFEGLGHALSTLRFSLVRLSMPRNGISSRAVHTLMLDCLWHCEVLEHVDLSGNKGITSSAGRTCVKFARHRVSLLTFDLSGTYVFNATRAIIDGLLQERRGPQVSP